MQNRCRQTKAVLSWLLRRVQSQEERERKVAILVLTEVGEPSLLSPAGPPPDLSHPERSSQPLLPALQGVCTLGLPAGPPASVPQPLALRDLSLPSSLVAKSPAEWRAMGSSVLQCQPGMTWGPCPSIGVQ